ncbi:DNA-processing protein DprA [Rhodohalobacter sp. 8-1]|uniref:DNA-processing protein DprA n=1 Tax=Rhodohalobacter sp. 8-1 TaxID=3131972 RepID=UPI0030EECEC3
MQVPNFGVRTARVVLKKTGVDHAEDLFSLNVNDLLKIHGIGKERAVSLTQFDDWKKVDKILEKTEKSGAQLLSLSDPAYPMMLKQTFDPPIILWVKGDPAALSKPGIAVVGTRNPGRYGMYQAENWSHDICKAGLQVNSGLAYGVDSTAHKTAVKSGGSTVAVLGSGIDRIYPNRNIRLAAEIIEKGGAVVTEYPPGTKPDAVNFPERNRIVSGMSYGTLVVESGVKGGSMITARLALDQNREVFVVPHPLGYLKGEGCNYLIRTGQGKLVQTMDDLLEELSVQTENGAGTAAETVVTSKKWETAEDLSEREVELCKSLSEKSLHIDHLADKMETEPFKLSAILLELEMKGLIKQKAGKYFELT